MPEVELSTVERLKLELTNPLIVAGIIVLIGVLTPHLIKWYLYFAKEFSIIK